MIRAFTLDQLQDASKYFKNDDEELFLTPDELKERKQRRIRTPKERAWTIDSKLNALRDN